MGYHNRFIGGDITLIDEPVFNEPFKSFWLTPRQHQDALAASQACFINASWPVCGTLRV
ncbi:hypothetical protein MAHJHV33_48280 [Mycobacterium avium subsp. hominissuis]